ncbi:MAG: hypothetical protein ACXVH1_37670, partial [Solirubrobacteraceae bacterium]
MRDGRRRRSAHFRFQSGPVTSLACAPACEELCDPRWAASPDGWAGARPASVCALALARYPQPSVHTPGKAR